MRLRLVLLLCVAACGAEGAPQRPLERPPDAAVGEPALDGEALYGRRFDDGNTFACATCHALREPAADGLRRVGHPIGDAAARASFKNGQYTSLRDAVNTCVTEWMLAPALSEASPRPGTNFLEHARCEPPLPLCERASGLRIDALVALERSAEAHAAARDYLGREPETETSAGLRRLPESAQE